MKTLKGLSLSCSVIVFFLGCAEAPGALVISQPVRLSTSVPSAPAQHSSASASGPENAPGGETSQSPGVFGTWRLRQLTCGDHAPEVGNNFPSGERLSFRYRYSILEDGALELQTTEEAMASRCPVARGARLVFVRVQ